MNNILFIDTEVDVESKKILEVGFTTDNGVRMRSHSVSELLDFIDQEDTSAVITSLSTICHLLKEQ